MNPFGSCKADKTGALVQQWAVVLPPDAVYARGSNAVPRGHSGGSEGITPTTVPSSEGVSTHYPRHAQVPTIELPARHRRSIHDSHRARPPYGEQQKYQPVHRKTPTLHRGIEHESIVRDIPGGISVVLESPTYYQETNFLPLTESRAPGQG